MSTIKAIVIATAWAGFVLISIPTWAQTGGAAGGAAGGAGGAGGAAGGAQPGGAAGGAQAGGVGNQQLNPNAGQNVNPSAQMFAPPPLNLPNTTAGAQARNGANPANGIGGANGALTPPERRQQAAANRAAQRATTGNLGNDVVIDPQKTAANRAGQRSNTGNLGNDVVNPMAPQFHQGRWWQSMPNDQWAYWNNDGWARFQGPDYRGEPNYYGQRYRARTASDANAQAPAGSDAAGSVGRNVAGSLPGTSPDSAAAANQTAPNDPRSLPNQAQTQPGAGTQPQSAAAAAELAARQQAASARQGYRWYDNRWWFQLPQNRWAYWGGDGWVQWNGANYRGQPVYLGDRYQFSIPRPTQ